VFGGVERKRGESLIGLMRAVPLAMLLRSSSGFGRVMVFSLDSDLVRNWLLWCGR